MNGMDGSKTVCCGFCSEKYTKIPEVVLFFIRQLHGRGCTLGL